MWGTVWGTVGALLGHCWGTVLFLETVHICKLYHLKSKAAVLRVQVCAAVVSGCRWGCQTGCAAKLVSIPFGSKWLAACYVSEIVMAVFGNPHDPAWGTVKESVFA